MISVRFVSLFIVVLYTLVNRYCTRFLTNFAIFTMLGVQTKRNIRRLVLSKTYPLQRRTLPENSTHPYNHPHALLGPPLDHPGVW